MQLNQTIQLNNVIIESRHSNGYINATQLCKAGERLFNDWYRLKNTKELVRQLSINTGINVLKLIDSKQGGNHSGSWIHPDLAVQLAQWISPLFALQVSRWVRELFACGTVSLNSQKTSEEILQLEQKLAEATEINRLIEANKARAEAEVKEKDNQLHRLYDINKELLSYKKLKERNETIYIISSFNLGQQGLFKIERTKNLKSRLSSYNTSHPAGNHLSVLAEYKVHNASLVEGILHKKLDGLRPADNREFFMAPLNKLKEIVALIIDNNGEQNEAIDRLIDLTFAIKSTFAVNEWISPEDLALLRAPNRLMLTCNSKSIDLGDVSNWTQTKIDTEMNIIWEIYTERRRIEELVGHTVHWNDLREIIKEKYNPRRIGPWRDLFKECAPRRSLRIKWRETGKIKL